MDIVKGTLLVPQNLGSIMHVLEKLFLVFGPGAVSSSGVWCMRGAQFDSIERVASVDVSQPYPYMLEQYCYESICIEGHNRIKDTSYAIWHIGLYQFLIGRVSVSDTYRYGYKAYIRVSE